MGKFFEDFEKAEEERRRAIKESGGGAVFLSKAEKELLISDGVAFRITNVKQEPENKFGPRYVVTVELEGESRKVGFGKGSVFTRDRMLEYIKEMLDAGAEPPTMKIELDGRSQMLVEVE